MSACKDLYISANTRLRIEKFALSCRGLPKLVTSMSKSTSVGEIRSIEQVADDLKITERTIYN